MSGRRAVRGLAGCALLAALCACSLGSGPQGGDPATRAEAAGPPVTLNIAHLYSDAQLPEGDTNEDHFLTRYLTEQTGVTVRYAWEAIDEVQYWTKLDLAIRSNDLPDAFVANREQFRLLTESGSLEDLTETYEAHASDLVKSLYDSTGGKALEDASVEDRLYGLPNIAIEADAPTYVWVRQDWLDRLRLPAPRTLGDIGRIARAFVASDPDGNGEADTVGIPVDQELVYGEKTGVNGLNGVFASFRAFPKEWIRDKEGNVVYGSVQPEAGAALAKLADWYREGILDRDFALRKDAQELIATNRAGLFFGPWWAPYYPLSKSVSNDTKAEWKVYAAPVDAQGVFVANLAPATDRYLVVRKGFPNPEAAVKLLNAMTRLERSLLPEDKPLRDISQQTGVQLRNYYPFNLLLDYPDAVVKRHEWLVKALNGEVDPEDLDPETKRLYDSAMQEREAPLKNMEAWSMTQAYLQGGEVSKADKAYVPGLFYGTTPAMEQKWERLQKLEKDTYLKLITGELPPEAFDLFVLQWKREGGEQITQEVAEAVGAR